MRVAVYAAVMHDAEPVEFPSTRYPRIEPREPLVWIRVSGVWRAGRVVKWVHETGRDRWVVWARWRGERPASENDWLLYDPEAIRPRREGEGAPQE